MYELYILDPWGGSSRHFFNTLEEVIDELVTWGFRFVWDYLRGRNVLHATIHDGGHTRGIRAQVFEKGNSIEITRQLLTCERL